MHSCLFSGVLAALLTFGPTVSPAQDMLGGARPVRGVSRTTAPPPEIQSAPSAVPPTGGITVSRDTKLNAGDEITVVIKEDRDPALRTFVTDTGEVELPGLGRVFVSGKSSTEAETIIASYLKQRYYNQVTVEVGMVHKAPGQGARPFKVLVTGKVGRPGPYLFTEASPLKLTEAVMVAGTSVYSDLKKVRLSRGGRTTDHDVKSITKDGRTDLDVPLKDGDQIYVPAVGIRFGSE